MNPWPPRLLPPLPRGASAYEAKVVLERSIAGWIHTVWEISVTGGMFPSPVPRLGGPAFTRIGNSKTDPQGERCALDLAIRAYGLGLVDYFVADLSAGLGPAMLEAAADLSARAGLTPSKAQLILDEVVYDTGRERPSLWRGSLTVWLPQADPKYSGAVFSIDAGIIGSLSPMHISAPRPHQGSHLVTDHLNAVFGDDVRAFFHNQLGYLERL